MTPEERERAEFRRIELVTQMERDRGLIRQYRENELDYIDRLIEAAQELGELNERLR